MGSDPLLESVGCACAISRSVLIERKHALILVTGPWQRRDGLILSRSGLDGLPFGFSTPTLLPVFFCARRTPGLFWDCWLGAMLAYAKLFCPLSSFFLAVAGGLVTLRSLVSSLVVFSTGFQALALLNFGWIWSAWRLPFSDVGCERWGAGFSGLGRICLGFSAALADGNHEGGFKGALFRNPRVAEHSPPMLPVGSFFPVPIRFEVEVRVQMDQVLPAHASVGDSGDNACDVDVAVLKVLERFLVPGGNGQREHRAIGKDWAETASRPRIKALAADDQFVRLHGSTSGVELSMVWDIEDVS